MIRNFIATITKKISERRDNPRYKLQIPIKVWFEPEKKAGKLPPPQLLTEDCFICGETFDLSITGIAITVPSIRIRENYLVGENRTLNAELDLPDGKVSMQIVGTRYEQIGEHLSVARYLIGARILQMTPENMKVYEHFLHNGHKILRKAASSLALEVDEV